MLLAETLVLGDNLLAYMVLAFGGAMAVGNTLAIARPPERPKSEGDLDRAPVIRSVVFARRSMPSSSRPSRPAR